MVNNPFRAKRNTSVQKDTEEWGKTKFKPNKFGRGGGNFKSGRGARGGANFSGGRGGRGGGKFNTGRGGVNKPFKEVSKFNQVDRDAKPENATPWNKFKDEIVFKQRDEERTAQQANMDSEEGKKILKQREVSYRKLLMEQKKQEPTQWDDFGEGEKDTNQKKNGKNSPNTQELKVPKNYDSKSKTKFKKNKKSHQNFKDDNKLDATSKLKFKKTNNSNFGLNADVKQFISKEILENFNSKKLNFEQNDKLRSAITKTTNMCFGNSLKQAVDDMKYQKKKKEKKLNKKFIEK